MSAIVVGLVTAIVLLIKALVYGAIACAIVLFAASTVMIAWGVGMVIRDARNGGEGI